MFTSHRLMTPSSPSTPASKLTSRPRSSGILTRWGLKFTERRGPGALATVVSSRVFAWLLRDVLRCGTGSENKALPRLAFNVAPALRRELVRGAFSGDGAATLVQQGRNLML